MFSTVYQDVVNKIEEIDPIKYGRTRNHIDGAVTKLSPYISRGVISTKMIADKILSKGYTFNEIEFFLKELAWRDYYQQVHIALKDNINADVRQLQENVTTYEIPSAIVNANTSIDAIDQSINELYTTGYMHNHLRLYIASICCNIAQCHWSNPSTWMYYHLLDADWASNTLSWQWVAGSFGSKKYFANQENINKYCNSSQLNTFLDVSYDSFNNIKIPVELTERFSLNLAPPLPEPTKVCINEALPTYIYNFYNLDCTWDADINANRILLLEPSFFTKYPVCKRTIDFVIDLSKNISNLQVFVGEFMELFPDANDQHIIHFKEHPLFGHYKGTEHKRDWIFAEVTGYFPSFFSYWKACKKLNQIGV